MPSKNTRKAAVVNGTGTILDLAAQLKLSPATISRVLNNHPHVKEQTKKMVLEAIEKMGYRRNALASGLRSKKTRTIGMIVPRISMFFHAAVITRVQMELYKQGYHLIISQSNDDPNIEADLVQTFYASRADAVIVACSLNTTSFDSFRILMNAGTPLLFYDRLPNELEDCHAVLGDDFRGGYLAGKCLLEAGAKRPAHLGGPLSSNLYQARRAGFEKACREFGLIPEKLVASGWIHHAELTAEQAIQFMEQLMREDVDEKAKPDAIFTANDATALAILEYCRNRGLRVPQDVKIIGYSNDPRTAITQPSIATIEQYPEQVAETVAETILQMMTEPATAVKTGFKKVVTRVGLIKRDSV